LIAALSVCILVSTAAAQTESLFDRLRREMVEQVIIADGIKNSRVIEAIRNTPRHEFVPLDQRQNAYYDMGLPIGEGQTISSPFIVAFMTEQLDPQPTDKVLEIGTGSGYQAAVLSPLVKTVYTIEIVEPLGRRAIRTLRRLRYDNIFVKVGDGFQGWPEHAPFDKIIVTCSPDKVPQPLVDQLREGGLMVVPVGELHQQTLYLLRKKDGKLESEALRPTLFVPMTGIAEKERGGAGRTEPSVVNGDFEQDPGDATFVPGWYYQRQATLEATGAFEGQRCLTLRNELPGRLAHIMQGFPVDGRKVAELNVSAGVKTTNAEAAARPMEKPFLAVTFYDANREEIGVGFLGPFLGTADWQSHRKTIRVPPTAREGIIRLGLFGATGEISFDNVKIEAVAR
jgi:protein-L-isoaspartate(D-aspartate) O-methyltransferase